MSIAKTLMPAIVSGVALLVGQGAMTTLMATGVLHAPAEPIPKVDSQSANANGEPAEVHYTPPEPPRSDLSVSYQRPADAASSTLPSPAQTASSALKETSVHHVAARLADGDKTKAWCEAKPDQGVGETFSVAFEPGSEAELAAIGLWTGYAKSEGHFTKNSRLSRVHLTLNCGGGALAIPMVDQDFMFEDANREAFIPLPGLVCSQGYVELNFEILDVYAGSKYADTCVSEVALYSRDPARAASNQAPAPVAPTEQPPAATAANPSFDCTKAEKPDELLLCSDAVLADMDREMAVLYKQVYNRVGGRRTDKGQALRSNQRAWLDRRTACASGSVDHQERHDCIAALYGERMVYLGSYR